MQTSWSPLTATQRLVQASCSPAALLLRRCWRATRSELWMPLMHPLEPCIKVRPAVCRMLLASHLWALPRASATAARALQAQSRPWQCCHRLCTAPASQATSGAPACRCWAATGACATARHPHPAPALRPKCRHDENPARRLKPRSCTARGPQDRAPCSRAR